jgi:diaminopimelate epimerase
MQLSFSKYQGTGNDFILINQLELAQAPDTDTIAHLCHRKFGIGADGLMLLQKADGYDFRMVYYNADGKEGTMCGNGGRCITRFAYDSGLRKRSFNFIAVDGPHEASIELNGLIRLKMKNVAGYESHTMFDVVDTGSPHVVKDVQDLTGYDVYTEGKAIRNSKKYAEAGINVNFVQVLDKSMLYVRTFERGVEDETLSCGTGVTAAALVHAHNERGFNHVEIKTNGGRIYVEFEKTGDRSFENIWLIGPVEKVFEGTIAI